MLQTPPSSPCDFLNVCLKSIKKDHPRLSTAQLSKKLKVSQSALSRIENKDVARPSFKNALTITRAAYPNEKNYDEILRKFYPDMEDTYSRVYEGNKDVAFVSPDTETYFQDPTTYEIMMLATSETATTIGYIKEQYGKKGIQILEELLDKKILHRSNGKIKLGPDKRINAGQDTVQKLLGNLVNLSYDVDSFGNKDNWLTVQYESVDKNYVLPKLMEIMKKANKEVRELFTSPSATGDDVLWVGLAMHGLNTEGRE